ncbi:exopolysaccharide biosynthesis protein [Devosia geojensis]|uniref:Exopolysaccharide biosynthesis protein n=2 Tax=Devosia geojensis TaxID=443610 RepID=A0A0F5FT76_9HYPH|nr:exopolysaccharide biosynthesis protein [Devosia geojensis]
MNGQPTPVFPSRDRIRQLALKRLFDIAVALAALMVLAPLFCLVAVAIRLGSRGPVFFRQTREGYEGRAFRMFKFRTMHVEDCDVSGVSQTIEGDPRVTAVGRFLRRTSIDELPQLINVVLGDMSIVGPRPHVSGMMAGGMLYTQLVPYYSARLDMLPGITGWAQANGLRGTTQDSAVAKARIDYDIAYIQNFSLMLDLRIIWMTFRREFISGTGS